VRRILVALHRWFGLFTAVFLFIAGTTGALIAWDHEIDALLNPDLYQAPARGTPRDPLELADAIEQRDPRLQVTYVALELEPGHALQMSVQPRKDPRTGKAHELDFDQLAVDPATGEILGQRMWGEASLSRRNLMPFLYKLHYTLHLPHAFDLDVGTLLMGLVAIVWSLDAFIALWISFPSWSAWRKSFAFRVRAGGYRLIFDLHRSGGVWVWPLLLMLGVTAISMNLGNEVMRPLVGVFSPLAASPFDTRPPLPLEEPAEPRRTRHEVLALARRSAQKHGLAAPAGVVFYSPFFNTYGVGFFEPGNDHGDGTLGNPWLYFDGQDGRSIGEHIPGEGSAGDVFMQAQFPLHSGRIAGVAGRIAVSLLGLVIATLSVTGIVIWARKRRARSREKVRVCTDDALAGEQRTQEA